MDARPDSERVAIGRCCGGLRCLSTTISNMDTTLTAAKTVELQHPAGYTADIALQGATVVSWKVNGEEKLFTSSKCVILG